MATIRPHEFPKDRIGNPDREETAFQLLQANLPEDAIVVYEPFLWDDRGRYHKPDFVVFWPEVGAVVIEDKNWNFERIKASDGKTVERCDGSTCANPFVQADRYKSILLNYLTGKGAIHPELRQSRPPYKGKLAFCITPCVLLMGADDKDISVWSEKLRVGVPYILSEETLRNPERLQKFLVDLPKMMPLRGEQHVMTIAADLLCPASEGESTLAEINKSLDELAQIRWTPEENALVDGPKDGETEMEKYSRYRRLLGIASDKLANLIASQFQGNEALEATAIHPSASSLARISQDLAVQKFLVGVFGTTAAGKSTFTNALVQEAQLLREALGETTRVITRIRKSEPDAENPCSHRTTVLRYKTAEQITDDARFYLSRLAIGEEELKAHAQLALGDPQVRVWLNTQVENAQRSNEPEFRNAAVALRDLLKGWDECHELLGKETTYGPEEFEKSDALVHRPNLHLACYILERVIYHNNAFTEHGIELVDAPGVGANLQDTNRALKIAQEADAFLMVTSVGFKLMQPDQAFLQKLGEVFRGKTPDHLIFIMNKLSLVPPDPDLATAVKAEEDNFRSKLDCYGFGEAPIYSVDSLSGRSARQYLSQPNNPVWEREFKRTKFAEIDSPTDNLAASRLPEVEELLIQHLATRKYNTVLDGNLRRAEKAVSDYAEDLKKKLSDLNREVRTIEAEMDEHRHRKTKTEKKLKEFLDYTVPGKVREIAEHKLPERVETLSHRFAEAILEKARRRLDEKIETSTAKQIVLSALDELRPFFLREVDELRNQLETDYRQIRADALENDIPEIIVQYYGDKTGWDLKKENLQEVQKKCLQSIDEINPGQWRIFWLRITNWSKATFIEAISEAVRDNFYEDFSGKLKDEVAAWALEDMDSFVSQTKAHFEDLMQKIEQRIKARIEERKKYQAGHAETERKLETFHEESERIVRKLENLRRELVTRRPFEPAQASV